MAIDRGGGVARVARGSARDEESVLPIVASSPPASPASASPLPEAAPALVPPVLAPLIDPDAGGKKTEPDSLPVPTELPLVLPEVPVDAVPLLLEPQPISADNANAVKARRALVRTTEYCRIRSLRERKWRDEAARDSYHDRHMPGNEL
jgi:hypothetical protein